MGRRSERTRGATIIDVAREAGVSPMTVSRVINAQPGVGEQTRAAVKATIDRLGYTPNVAARSLVTAGELRIGVVYSNPSAAFMSEFLTGVFEEASTRGARLTLLKGGAGGRGPSTAEVKALAASGVSGVILAPPLGEAPSILRILAKAQLPTAAVGAYGVAGAVCVRIDDRRAAYEMTRELITTGHKRLGFILGNPDQAASAERLAGFYEAVREAGDVTTSIAQGDFSFDSGLAAAEQLLASPTPPTAIFASNDDMAAAAVSVAHRRHLDVPEALSVVGFDDTAAAVTLWPPLTTVRQPVRQLAAQALGLLIADIGREDREAKPSADHVLDHEIVTRRSNAPPQEAKTSALLRHAGSRPS